MSLYRYIPPLTTYTSLSRLDRNRLVIRVKLLTLKF